MGTTIGGRSQYIWRMTYDAEVQAYIDSIAIPWQRKICIRLRQLIRESAPSIAERVAWSSPAFYCRGQIAWMFCAKEWVHFAFPQGALLEAPPGTWDEGEGTRSKAKRTMKFREGDSIPESLVVGLVRQAVVNDKAGRRIDFSAPKAGSRSFDLPKAYRDLLHDRGRLEAFLDRPYYQQSGWLRWIEAAKTDGTREKRIELMFEELATGQYMPTKAERRRPAGAQSASGRKVRLSGAETVGRRAARTPRA